MSFYCYMLHCNGGYFYADKRTISTLGFGSTRMARYRGSRATTCR
jgi:hypothetical protein